MWWRENSARDDAVKSANHSRHDENGFSLLLVLIALAVISLIVASVIETARQRSAEVSAEVDQLELRAAFDGATATVTRELSETGASEPSLLLHPETITLGNVAVTVTARSEATKIDLNRANPALLRAFLFAASQRPKFADRITDEILDWRDADSDPRPHGAETANYLFAGRTYGPTNGNFASVSEIGLLLDGGDDLVTCLGPDVTVFSGRSDVEPSNASPRVRAAVAAAGGAASSAQTVISAPIVGGNYVQPGEIFEITLSTDGALKHRSRQIVVRVTGNPTNPVWLLSNATPAPIQSDSDAACARLRKQHPD